MAIHSLVPGSLPVEIESTLRPQPARRVEVPASDGGNTQLLWQGLSSIYQGVWSHGQRVASYALCLGEDLGLPPAKANSLYTGALFHDIGKTMLPGALFAKSGELTDAERAAIRRHPALGLKALVQSDLTEDALLCVRCHHERWDGHGYPAGIAARDLPEVVRIVSILDAFDAMTARRPYRRPISKSAALLELRLHAGTQFDPEMVDAFVGSYTGAPGRYSQAEWHSIPPGSPGISTCDAWKHVRLAPGESSWHTGRVAEPVA